MPPVALMTVPSLRFMLRERTRPAHERLDRLVGPIDTPERYRGFLRASYAYRVAVEDYLRGSQWPPAFGGWRPNAIAPLIAEDLADLGLACPAWRPLPLPNDMPGLIGVAYVLEGSSLGARLIVQMAAGFGFDAAHGARHLAVQAQGLSNWRHFVGIIDGLPGVDGDAAAAAASVAFDHAAAAMKDNGFS